MFSQFVLWNRLMLRVLTRLIMTVNLSRSNSELILCSLCEEQNVIKVRMNMHSDTGCYSSAFHQRGQTFTNAHRLALCSFNVTNVKKNMLNPLLFLRSHCGVT